jgi:glutathione S-transferase
MGIPRLIYIYQSPWSERARWGFEFKGVPYERVDYQVGTGEEELNQHTGQVQVPVLDIDGSWLSDSTAILNWLEDHHPQPALLPEPDAARAEVVLWEELMDGVLGPQARVLITGRLLASSDPQVQQLGQFLSEKYHYSAGYAEAHARTTVRRCLTMLAHTLTERRYLVGDTFTRADLTTACMLALVNPPPDDLFFVPSVAGDDQGSSIRL